MKNRTILSGILAGCMAFSMLAGPAMAAEASSEAQDEMVKSYLTGETVPASIGRKRPLAIMLENTPDALPQYGISSADVVYEAMVEGSITRLMGIFEDYQNIDRIGTVRSCRPYYVFFAREFNAFYAHYGQVIYAVPVLQLDKTYDIAGLPYGEDGQDYTLNDGSSAFYRGDDRPAPHNVFTTYDGIQSVVKSSGWKTDYSDGYTGHYQFAEDGQEIGRAHV